MFCPKCGNKNDDGAAFCGICGNKLGPASEAKQAPAVSTTATGGVTTGDGSTAAAAHNAGRIIGVVVAVAAIAAVAIAGFATNWFGLMGSTVRESVNDYSWDELSTISAEIAEASDKTAAIEVAKGYNLCTSDGKLDGTQEKSVTLSDGTETSVQIAGFLHDDKTDGGKAGITFIFKRAIACHEMNSSNTNSGGWENSQMRAWLTSDGLSMLPEDLKGQIVAVNKLTNNTGETESVSSVTSTSDKLWLYSFVELAGNTSESDFNSEYGYLAPIYNAEGSQYKLYSDAAVNKSGSNGILVKRFDGVSYYWWERSPVPRYSDVFRRVNDNGNPGEYNVNPTDTYGVVPGFCI